MFIFSVQIADIFYTRIVLKIIRNYLTYLSIISIVKDATHYVK